MVFEKKIIKNFCDKYIINDKMLFIPISLWEMFVIHFQYMEKWLSYFYRKNAYHTVSYIKKTLTVEFSQLLFIWNCTKLHDKHFPKTKFVGYEFWTTREGCKLF